MQTKFINFKKFEIENVWPLARDLVQLACDTNGAFDAEDIKALCKQGAMQLWLVLHHVKDLETWAKGKGCKKMELFARPGWSKLMKTKGYEKTHVQLEKEL